MEVKRSSTGTGMMLFQFLLQNLVLALISGSLKWQTKLLLIHLRSLDRFKIVVRSCLSSIFFTISESRFPFFLFFLPIIIIRATNLKETKKSWYMGLHRVGLKPEHGAITWILCPLILSTFQLLILPATGLFCLGRAACLIPSFYFDFVRPIVLFKSGSSGNNYRCYNLILSRNSIGIFRWSYIFILSLEWMH